MGSLYYICNPYPLASIKFEKLPAVFFIYVKLFGFFIE